MQARIWAAEAEVPYDRILLSYADRRAILDGLGLHDDGRNYSLLPGTEKIPNQGARALIILSARFGRFPARFGKNDLEFETVSGFFLENIFAAKKYR